MALVLTACTDQKSPLAPTAVAGPTLLTATSWSSRFITNPRELTFPASRTWTRAGGDGPSRIRFTRRNARAAEYDYALLAES